MKKKVVFLLAAVLMMASCREKGGLDAAEQTSFETMTVSKQDITLEQSYPAQIDGRQSVKIIPRVEGYLRQICVKEGQRVKKGQVLFVIDQATYQAEVKAAEANVAVAKAGVETAQLNYDSRKTLFQKDVVSDYDLRTATANLSMAKAQSQQAQAQLLSARTNLSYTVLRSPSDGVVGSLPFRIGDFVGPSTQSGLTTVADAYEMYVYFSLTERDVMSRIAEHGSLDKAVAVFDNFHGQCVTPFLGEFLLEEVLWYLLWCVGIAELPPAIEQDVMFWNIVGACLFLSVFKHIKILDEMIQVVKRYCSLCLCRKGQHTCHSHEAQNHSFLVHLFKAYFIC